MKRGPFGTGAPDCYCQRNIELRLPIVEPQIALNSTSVLTTDFS